MTATTSGLSVPPALSLADNGSRSWLLQPTTGGGVLAKTLAGPTLTDIHPSKPRYFATPRHAVRLTVHDIRTDTLLADRPVEAIVGSGAVLLDSVAVVSEGLLVAAVYLDQDFTLRRHVVLSADTLQRRSMVDYPHVARQRAVGRSAETGTWMTTAGNGNGNGNGNGKTLCLWRLDGLLDDDPLPSQQALF